MRNKIVGKNMYHQLGTIIALGKAWCDNCCTECFGAQRETVVWLKLVEGVFRTW